MDSPSPRISNRLAKKRRVMEEEGKEVAWKVLMKKSNRSDSAEEKPDTHTPSSSSKTTSSLSLSSVTSRQLCPELSTESTVPTLGSRGRQVTTLNTTNEMSLKISRVHKGKGGLHKKHDSAVKINYKKSLDKSPKTTQQKSINNALTPVQVTRKLYKEPRKPVITFLKQSSEDKSSETIPQFAKDISVNNRSEESQSNPEDSSSCISETYHPEVQHIEDVPVCDILNSNADEVITSNDCGTTTEISETVAEEICSKPVEDSSEEINEAETDKHDISEEQIQENTLQLQMATPIKKTLTDIIINRQEGKQKTDVVAATIAEELLPEGTSSQIQDILGLVAMETNVEFMLTDSFILVYGSWEDVEQAKKKLAEEKSNLEQRMAIKTETGETAESNQQLKLDKKLTMKKKQTKEYNKQMEENKEQTDEQTDDNTEQTGDNTEQTDDNTEQIDDSTEQREENTEQREENKEQREENTEQREENTEHEQQVITEQQILLEMIEPSEQAELENSAIKGYLEQQPVSRQEGSKAAATHTCVECGFKSTKQGVDKHRMRFHNELQHSCIVCGRMFGLRYDMRCHRVTHFNVQGELLRQAMHLWEASNPGLPPVHLSDIEKGFRVASDSELKIEENESCSETGEQEEDETASEIIVAPPDTKSYDIKKHDLYICKVCEYIGREAALRKHVERLHPSLTYRCAICYKRSGVVSDMQKHLRTHEEYKHRGSSKFVKENVGCESCDFIGNVKDVKSHITSKHGVKCQYMVLDQKSMKSLNAQGIAFKPERRITTANLTLPKDNEKFYCEICNKEVLLSRYKHHIKCHDYGPRKCEQCDFVTREKSALLKHMQKVHNSGFFTCQFCSQTFTTPSSMKFHIDNIHNRTEITCSFCNKMFSTQRFLNVHIQRVHKRIKRYFCDVCSKGFFEKFRMLQHRTVHGTEEDKQAMNKWKCSFCDRRFRTKFCVKQHENTHTGEKPFKCRHCPRSFAWATEARNHEISMHTEGATKYVCSQCGRGFKFQHRLVSHMLMHTNNCQHKCNRCGKAFKAINMLNKHRCNMTLPDLYNRAQQEDLTSEEVKYMCGVCQEYFDSADEICQHIKDSHDPSSQVHVLNTRTDLSETQVNDLTAGGVNVLDENVIEMVIPNQDMVIIEGDDVLPADTVDTVVSQVQESVHTYHILYENPDPIPDSVEQGNHIEISETVEYSELVEDSCDLLKAASHEKVVMVGENGEILQPHEAII